MRRRGGCRSFEDALNASAADEGLAVFQLRLFVVGDGGGAGAADEPPVARYRHVAEGVGGVREGVMHGHFMHDSVGTGWGGAVALQRRQPGRRFDAVYLRALRTPRVKNAVPQEPPRQLNIQPQVVGAWQNNGVDALRHEVVRVRFELRVPLRGVVRQEVLENTLPVHRLPRAHHGDVVRERLVVGGVAVQQVETPVRAGLHEPQRGVVGHADVPRNIQRMLVVRLKRAVEPSLRPQVGENGGVDGAFHFGAPGFFGDGGVLLEHADALRRPLRAVPPLLRVRERDAVVFLEVGEVVRLLPREHERQRRVDFIVGVPPPGVKEKAKLQVVQLLLPAVVHRFPYEAVILPGRSAFVRGLHDDDAIRRNGIDGSAEDAARFPRVRRRHGTEFGDVQELQRAAADVAGNPHGVAPCKVGAVGYEFGVRCGMQLAGKLGDVLAVGGVDDPVLTVGRRGSEAFVGKAYFAQLFLRVHQCLVVDTRFPVVLEKQAVEDVQRDERRESQLAGFEDVVAVPDVAQKILLRPVEPEAAGREVLALYPIKMIKPPLPAFPAVCIPLHGITNYELRITNWKIWLAGLAILG